MSSRKRENKVLHCSCAMMTKKCTKKSGAHTKLCFANLSLLFFCHSHSCHRHGCLRFLLVSLTNENADILDVRNSNRNFDVSFDRTLMSVTTNLNAFVLTSAVLICRVRALKERKYQDLVANLDVRDSNTLVA